MTRLEIAGIISRRNRQLIRNKLVFIDVSGVLKTQSL